MGEVGGGTGTEQDGVQPVVREGASSEVEAGEVRKRGDGARGGVGEALAPAEVDALEPRARGAEMHDGGVGDADVPVQAHLAEVWVVRRDGGDRDVADVLRGVEVDAAEGAAPRESGDARVVHAKTKLEIQRRGE